MPVSDLVDDLEEMAERTSDRVNGRTTGFVWSIPPHIERASAAREHKAIAVPQPADIEPAPPAEPHFQAAEVVCYSELIDVLRDRVGQLGVRYLDFDKLACWAEGLTGKAFGSAQIKRLAVDKVFDALRAAGLRLRVEEDPEQAQKMRSRIAENFLPRQARQARMGNRSNLSGKIIDDVLNHLANKKGGLTRLNAALKQARSNIARHAALASWERRRCDFAAHAGNVSRISSAPALAPPKDRTALDSCAEEEATAA
jgi:hypothetical protein